MRPRYGVHFGADAVKQRLPVVSHGIQIEMRLARQIGEVRLRAQAIQHRLELMRGAIEVESIGGSN